MLAAICELTSRWQRAIHTANLHRTPGGLRLLAQLPPIAHQLRQASMNIVKPTRVSRSYTQTLLAEPARVFPLLCPVREADWIDGWDPVCVFSLSGVAEKDCVFVTEATPHDAIWYITRHEAPFYVEMLKITPEVTACKLTIELRAIDSGTEAQVTYMHTSLGPRGDAFIASFSDEYYTRFMRDWESRLNHFLQHDTLLRT